MADHANGEQESKNVAGGETLLQSQEDCPVMLLPDDVMLHLFRFVDSKTLVDGVRRVCRRWRALSADASCWQWVHLDARAGDVNDVVEVVRLVRAVPQLHSMSLQLDKHDVGTELVTALHTFVKASASAKSVRLRLRRLDVKFHESQYMAVGQLLRLFQPSLEELRIEGRFTSFKLVNGIWDLSLRSLAMAGVDQVKCPLGLFKTDLFGGGEFRSDYKRPWTRPLERLWLAGNCLDLLRVAVAAHRDTLKQLRVEVHDINVVGPYVPESWLEGCGALEDVELDSHWPIATVKRLPNLRRLTLHQRIFTDPKRPALLADEPVVARLQSLQLVFEYVKLESLKPGPDSLPRMLAFVREQVTSYLTAVGKGCESLRALTVRAQVYRPTYPDDLLQLLAPLKDLASLTFQNVVVPRAWVSQLADGALPALRELRLYSCEIEGGSGSDLLAELFTKRPGLTVLQRDEPMPEDLRREFGDLSDDCYTKDGEEDSDSEDTDLEDQIEQMFGLEDDSYEDFSLGSDMSDVDLESERSWATVSEEEEFH